MISQFAPPIATIFVLFFLIHFSMASLGFLLLRFEVPEVTQLFRGLLNVYFRMISFTGLLAMAAFAASGRMAFTAGMLLLATAAIAARGRVLHCVDTQQIAWRAGDPAAIRRLRLIHWGAMLANIAILASVASSTRFIL
jgi:hypothetical protein